MDNENKKSRFLLVLSILSLIAAGFACLYYLMMMALTPEQQQEIANSTKEMTMSMSGIEIPADQVASIFKMFDFAPYLLAFNVIEIIGVVLLLTRRPIGFHIYVASQIACIWATYMIFNSLGMMMILLDIIFIYLYYQATSHLRQLQNNSSVSE